MGCSNHIWCFLFFKNFCLKSPLTKKVPQLVTPCHKSPLPTMATPSTPTASAATSGSFCPSDLVDNQGSNKWTIRCRHCNSKMISPGVAHYENVEVRRRQVLTKCCCKLRCRASTHFVEQHFLHFDKKSEREACSSGGDTENTFWVVADMFKFENMGFSNTVDGNYKYLTCMTKSGHVFADRCTGADCEREVVGIHYLNETPKQYFVAATRVRYD